MRTKSKKSYFLKGFTLIEVALVLMIVGIIGTAVFKGQDLLEAAKIRAVANDFQRLKVSFIMYQETYNALPGDDAIASSRFGKESIVNGNGNHIIEPSESLQVWQHLAKAGFVGSSEPPSSKLGGYFSITYQPADSMPGHWLQLSNPNKDGLLTPKQAQSLKSKLDDAGSKPNEGSVRIMNGTSGGCVSGDNLNISTNTPVCIVLMQL